MAMMNSLYGKQNDNVKNEIYLNCLYKYSIEEVESAVKDHINDHDIGQFYPKPADICRKIEGNIDEESLLVWSRVFDAIKNHGQYKSVSFDNPVIHRVINDMGGWVQLCNCSLYELDTKRSEFQTRYKIIKKRGDTEARGFLQGLIKAIKPIEIKTLVSKTISYENDLLGVNNDVVQYQKGA